MAMMIDILDKSIKDMKELRQREEEEIIKPLRKH